MLCVGCNIFLKESTAECFLISNKTKTLSENRATATCADSGKGEEASAHVAAQDLPKGFTRGRLRNTSER